MDGEKERILKSKHTHTPENAGERIRSVKKTTSNTPSEQPAISFSEALDEILRQGARKMLMTAAEAEVVSYIETRSAHPDGKHYVCIRAGDIHFNVRPDDKRTCSPGDHRGHQGRQERAFGGSGRLSGVQALLAVDSPGPEGAIPPMEELDSLQPATTLPGPQYGQHPRQNAQQHPGEGQGKDFRDVFLNET